MSASRILIADQDMEYGRAFARAVSSIHNEFEITLKKPEMPGKAKDAACTEHLYYDLVLIGGYPDEIEESVFAQYSNRKRVVILTDYYVESIHRQSEKETQFWYLFKYSEVSQMISDLNFLIGFLSGKKSLLRKNTAPDLIGFFGISGGTGKTAAALGVSRELSRYHDKKILYLSFEEIPATELMINGHSQNRNIGDYLYFLIEKNNESLCSRLDSFTISDEYGVETFSPTGGRNDLNELTRDELIHFLKVISDSCRYDHIIFDLKNDLSAETMYLLSLCRRIVVVQTDDPISRFKTRKLETYLSMSDIENPDGRFILIVNRTNSVNPDQGDSDSGSLKIRNKIYIENDENSFHSAPGHFGIDITHAFGIGVGKVVDELLSSGKEK